MEEVTFNGEKGLDKDTPIYRYMPIDSFLHFLVHKEIWFTKLTKWPDAFEGARFEFLKKKDSEDRYSNKNKDYFFGSAWTLQNENSCIFKKKNDHRAAEEELQKSGSASMWQGYCPQGGARIKTTIGKVENILSQQFGDSYKGEVQYEPLANWRQVKNSSGLISLLFIKGVSFRHESEYRFILVSRDRIEEENHLYSRVGDLYEFIDEILISPAISNNEYVSKTLYHCGVSLTYPRNIPGTNDKNGRQYCRISNLYGLISEKFRITVGKGSRLIYSQPLF